MSQTKVFQPLSDTTTRVALDGSRASGAGNSKRYYAGKTADNNYDAYAVFTPDWTGVGKIVSAILTLYTDDDFGTQGSFVSTAPKVLFRRLTSAFSEHTNSEIFVTADYAKPAHTAADAFYKTMAAAELAVNNVDITKFAEMWAPATVKRRDGTPGGGAANHGIGMLGTSITAERWAGISMDCEAGLVAYKPYITLTYEYGLTVPSTPANLTPTGSVVSIGSFQGDFADVKATDKLRYSGVEVYTAAATNVGQVVTGGTRLYSVKQAESESAVLAARFDHIAATFHPVKNVTYKWRAQVHDQEGQVSLWSNLVSFLVTNTDPNQPILSPVSGASRASMDGVLFRGGTFTDPDAGDKLGAYQVQLSAYPEGDSHWKDDEFILWNTGKRYVESGATNWETPYGGDSLAIGTYYWRARQWDNHQGVSLWRYATITLTAAFVVEAQDRTNAIQLRVRAPWRIVIRGMGALRGPGSVVAIIEDAFNVGASVLYNSPGEAHWTLSGTHPQISVIEPKQTHYAIEFRQGDGWREVFAGLVDDFDASDRDVIFYGRDYLSLLDSAVDEHYDPVNPDLPAEKGGSKYVTTGKNSINYIVTDQLKRAREVANSPVGFITTGTIAAMTETMTAFSTYQPTLAFITGLLNSHRAGTGKRTRLSVQKTTTGYKFVVQDDPGVIRNNLRLRYGELVQGYRVIPFGNGWATRIAGFGRDKDGVLVRYKSLTAPGISEATWGRWVRAVFYDGVADANDLERKIKQDAIAGSKLGGQVGLGLRSGVLQPRDGYDVCDIFPVDIEHQAVSTSAFGSGYWVAVGITWTAMQQGDLTTILTLSPREDATAPDNDLLTLSSISGQAEWQIGWDDPNPLNATSKYWLDQSTGIVYERTAGGILVTPITGDV